MNIKTRPFGIAVAAGAAVLAVISLVSALLSRPDLANFDPNSADPMDLLRGSAVSLISCLLILLVVPATGALYAYLHSQEAPISGGEGAIGGAAVGALAYFLASIVGTIISFFVVSDMFASVGQELGEGGQSVMVMGGIIGAAFGLCFAVFIGAALGAVGGAIGGAMWNRP